MNSFYKRFVQFSIAAVVCSFMFAGIMHAKDGDTIHVETVQFTGQQSGVYAFPPDSVKYQKVLMNYTMKCPCGQWDYLEYVNINYRDTVHHDTVTYEILRFITPYGIGLNVGNNGFTWTMDVTDYSPLLHDSVWLSAGNGQEAVDVSFDIVTGTPPRNVLSIQPLWYGDHGYGGQPSIDSFLVTKRLFIPPSAKGVEMKVIQTGHGFGGDTINEGDSIYSDDCAEFCGKQQSIVVNGTTRFQRYVWRDDCGLNPVAAQGGTWVYNRSNWCPGSVVWPFDYELTPFITPGDSVNLQLKMQPYNYVVQVPGNTTPYYDVASFLVLYSAPNFTNDASIEDILAPTTKDLYERHNPICGGPIITIRNNGANDLKSLDITYGVKGGNHTNFHWTGDLLFTQEAQVTLPPFDWGSLSDTNTFEVTLSNPNDTTDEYAPNNYATSRFVVPPLYYNNLEVRLLTNAAAAYQYAWTLKNSEDSVVASADSLNDNTLYIDSLYLPDGCYTFRLVNYWGYGLSWWATSPQLGSGSLKLTSLGMNEYAPSGDFGAEIYQQFRVGAKPTIAVLADTLNFGAVDSGEQKTMTAYITPQNKDGLNITGVSLGSIFKEFKIVSITPPLDSTGQLTLNAGDTLAVTVSFSPKKQGVRFGTLSIATNDLRNPTVYIYLTGVNGATEVKQNNVAGVPDAQLLRLDAVPNVFSDASYVIYSANMPTRARLYLVNAVGEEVGMLYDGMLDSQPRTVDVSAKDLPAGMYFLVLSSGGLKKISPVVVVK